MENYKEFDKINEGLTNLGFTLYEAIMESIDDSLDAGSKNINIEVYEEFMEIDIKGEKKIANRLSYIIKDDGQGSKNLSEIFNFGNNVEKRFKSKDEYRSKNGIYHYGAISHLNVGSEVNFYSKSDEMWRAIGVKYDKFNKKGYISNEYALSDIEIEKLKSLLGEELLIGTGSIVHVRGISKKHVSNISSKKPTKYIIEKLKEKISISYRYYLENSEYKIRVNGNLVSSSDIFLYGDDVPDEIKSKKFATYEISLKQLLNKLDDEAEQSTLISTYEDIFKAEDLFEEKIYIDFYALNLKLKDSQIKEKYGTKYIMPTAIYSGIYINRNNRYIGDVAKIDDICTDHDDFNTFRGELRFSPAFDMFFGIQINKNRYTISDILYDEICNCIYNDNRYYTPQLNRATGQSRIRNALNGKINETKVNNNFTWQVNQDIKKTLDELKSLKRKLNNSILDKSKKQIINEYKKEIEQYCPKNMKECEVEERLNKIKNDIRLIKKGLTRLQKDYIEDYERLNNRIEKLVDKQEIIISKFNNILEPKNEAEMFGLLYLIISIYPEEFDFKIKDYDYKDGIDCLVELKNEVFEELKMNERINGHIEDIKECKGFLSDDLDIDDGTYCFLEMKMKLPARMNHSMRLVSHILCWERSEEPLLEMSTEYVNYDVDNDRDIITYNDEVRVKVVYLKEVIDQLNINTIE